MICKWKMYAGAANGLESCIGRLSGRWIEAVGDPFDDCEPHIEWEDDGEPLLCSRRNTSKIILSTEEGKTNDTSGSSSDNALQLISLNTSLLQSNTTNSTHLLLKLPNASMFNTSTGTSASVDSSNSFTVYQNHDTTTNKSDIYNSTQIAGAYAYGAVPFFGHDGSLYMTYGSREPGDIKIVVLNESSGRLSSAAVGLFLRKHNMADNASVLSVWDATLLHSGSGM